MAENSLDYVKITDLQKLKISYNLHVKHANKSVGYHVNLLQITYNFIYKIHPQHPHITFNTMVISTLRK